MSTSKSLRMYYEEEGDGFYTRNSPYTKIVYSNILESAEQLIDKSTILENSGRPFTIVDYGTSDGLGLLTILPDLIDHVRMVHGKNKQIQVMFIDRPENDFKLILKAAREYMTARQSVFISAVGGCFFEQCVPDMSVDLVVCSTALHFITKLPCKVDSLFPAHADIKTQAICAKQAKSDLKQFLEERGKEMTKGGHMVLEFLGKDSKGRITNLAREDITSCTNVVENCWDKLYHSGIITKEEKESPVFPIVNFLTRSDVTDLFEESNSSLYKSGLRLLGIEEWVLWSPLYNAYQQSEDTPENRENYAKLSVANLKSWTANLFSSVLAKSRSSKECDIILDKLYSEVLTIMVNNPNLVVTDVVFFTITVGKCD